MRSEHSVLLSQLGLGAVNRLIYFNGLIFHLPVNRWKCTTKGGFTRIPIILLSYIFTCLEATGRFCIMRAS